MAQRRRKGISKRKKPKKPAHYLIHVVVNEKDGKFSYILAGSGTPATRIRPCNQDTVRWEVFHRRGRRLTRVPFQIEFEVSNPFGVNKRVFRSSGAVTARATVDLDRAYKGNRIFKYSVSTINFWSDDPDVVPVPPDGGVVRKAATGQDPRSVALSMGNSGFSLTESDASFTPGEVKWYWWPGTKGKDDFTLTFKNPPPGWPKGVLKSVEQELIVNFPTPLDKPESSHYDIVTVSTNEAQTGSLTIK